MGQALSPERSPPAPPKIKPILSLSESDFETFESTSEFSDADSTGELLLTTAQAQLLWQPEVLARFGLCCSSVSEDIEFDKLNNKLLSALKEFSTKEKLYCLKCKAMTTMTKKGKVNSTYQFACGTHTLSATQILGTLPDAFILAHLPKDPRDVFNSTLSWIGKDQLSPELTERSSKRNASKRYSAHRSPMKGPCTSLMTSRNSVNEVMIELKEIKSRVNSQERALEALQLSNLNLSSTNSELLAQVRLLKEENMVLKRHLNEPVTSTKKPDNPKCSINPTHYSSVADKYKPMNPIMKFYTSVGITGPKSPIQTISAPITPVPVANAIKSEFSPLKLVFFKGCHRKSIGEYKKMLPSIGFEAHWARHICFLAEDIIQITTFESKVDTLVKALTSISSDVKHLKDFNPLSGDSYSVYGNFTDESASKSYFSLMKQAAKNIASDAQRIPSLRRVGAFMAKIVENKDINFKAAPRPTRIFCLGDFIIQKEPVAMEIDPPQEAEQVDPGAMMVEKIPEITEAELDAILKDPALTNNAQ
jgi:hypothetical protein